MGDYGCVQFEAKAIAKDDLSIVTSETMPLGEIRLYAKRGGEIVELGRIIGIQVEGAEPDANG